jgi:hypothetical protein
MLSKTNTAGVAKRTIPFLFFDKKRAIRPEILGKYA